MNNQGLKQENWFDCVALKNKQFEVSRVTLLNLAQGDHHQSGWLKEVGRKYFKYKQTSYFYETLSRLW